MKLLIAGGAGFIGSHFVRYMIHNSEMEIYNVDALTYAGNLLSLCDVEKNPRYTFVCADITEEKELREVFETGIDYVVNFAAETHVDRSIANPQRFVHTNIVGVQTLLSLAKEFKIKRFLQVSTDEVYGSLGEKGYFREDSQIDPSSPYSASKAAADLLTIAYYRTFGVDTVVTRCSNNYGSHQFPEKLIPHCIIKALNNEKVPVYGDGQNIRDWLHVSDHCNAIALALEKGKAGEVYNIGGNNERSNLEIVYTILETLKKPKDLIEFVGDRPGHDRRYAIDAKKLHSLGWNAKVPFEQGIKDTVEWYVKNQAWWGSILSDDYRTYYKDKKLD